MPRVGEIFKLIPNWEKYRISNFGRLQRLTSTRWKEKRGTKDKDGYLRVILHNKNKCLYIGIHKLILISFIGDKEGFIPLHKNGIRDDNRLTNLKWGTNKENSDDRDKHGNTARFEKNGNVKLSWEKVNQIRIDRMLLKETTRQLAKRYEVEKTIIIKILRNHLWAVQNPGDWLIKHKTSRYV